MTELDLAAYSVDGRTLNQAFVECSSVEAAKAIVRSRDGTRLRDRPIHVAMSSQTELLTTVRLRPPARLNRSKLTTRCRQIFPTYKPGFDGLDAKPDRHASVSCQLFFESELAGLLRLCRLESPHAFKAPERPYYNIVSIIEKVASSFHDLGISERLLTCSRAMGQAPFHQAEAFHLDQVPKLFNACVSAVKTLKGIKQALNEWREILTVLVDAILRCPGFTPTQKRKVVKLAGGLGFVQDVPSKVCSNLV